jgi:hypothetical protein
MKHITFDTEVTFYNPDFTKKKVLDTEINPVIAILDKTGKIVAMEATDTDEGADCWSVYIRVDVEGMDVNPVDCIADFPTKEQAELFETLLRNLLKLK